jgi:hypothetical protein
MNGTVMLCSFDHVRTASSPFRANPEAPSFTPSGPPVTDGVPSLQLPTGRLAMLISNRATNILLVAILAAGIGIVAMLAPGVRGGPLDPPGPPSSSDGVRLPGTPIDHIPYTISTPGNYYLTRNLALATSGDGITIAADDVAIDLMGFTIAGPGVGFTGAGITGDGSFHKNVAVRGGTLAAWPGVAIFSSGIAPSRFEDLIMRKNGKGLVTDPGSTVRNIEVDDTADIAIHMFANSSIDGCVVKTATIGIIIGAASVVTRCSVSGAASGVQLGAGAHMSDCAVSSATVAAIEAGDGSVVDGCSVYVAGDGIRVSAGAQVTNCNVIYSTTAIKAYSGAVVRGCTVSQTALGIASTGALIEDNSIDSVTGAGACAITFSASGSRANANKIRGADNGICSAALANIAYQNTFDGIGIAIFVGPITSAPFDYPPLWTNPWANLGY